MTIALAVEDRLGMTFNHRRLSRDAVLYGKLVELAGDRLRAGPMSVDLDLCQAYVGPDYIAGAGPGDVCFVEDPADLEGVRPDEVWLFRWNRRYPYDKAMPVGLLDGMVLSRSEEFPGRSHDSITMEVYVDENA